MKNIAHFNAEVLKPIYEKVSVLQQLQDRIGKHLSDDLRANCRIANMESGVLKLAVASPVWATRLRYAIPELISSLRANGFPQLSSIEFYVEAEFRQLFTH